MKKSIIYLTALFVIGTLACEKNKTQVPELDKFSISAIVDDQTGSEIDLNSVPADSLFRIQVFTEDDICVLWTGDYSYKRSGENDSVIDVSHAYMHYGISGAIGFTPIALEGESNGYYHDYSWAPGSYDITIILSNHGLSGPDYETRIFEESITVVP